MLKRVAQLASSSLTSNLIPLIGLPISARLYDIDSFARLAVFLATISVVSIFVVMRYENAIPTVRNVKRVREMVIFCLSLTFAITALVTIGLLATMYVTKIFEINDLLINIDLIKLIAIAALGVGINQTLNAATLRYQNFKQLVISRIVQSIAITSIQILTANILDDGLIIGWLSGLWLTNIYLYASLLDMKRTKNKIKLINIIAIAKHYKNFPKYSLLGALCDTVAQQIPLYVVLHKYGGEAAAIYGMGIRLIAYPLSMISSAIGQVLINEITSRPIKNRDENINIITLIFKVLALTAALILAGVYFTSDIIIELYLGPNWKPLNEYILILATINLIRFMVSPLSSALGMRQHLSTVLRWQVVYMLSMMTITVLTYKLDFNSFLILLAIHESILYGAYALLIINKWR